MGFSAWSPMSCTQLAKGTTGGYTRNSASIQDVTEQGRNPLRNMAKKGCSLLRVDRGGCQSSKGVDYDIQTHCLIRINRILVTLRYTFFFESPTVKNFEVKCAWPGAILGWVINREVFPGAHK
jgi:hypothetical protein